MLAGAAGVAVAGCLDDGTGEPDADGADGTDELTDDGSAGPPFEIATIDAPGSEAGTTTVPREGTVFLVNFTRTACPTSEGMVSTIRDARDRLAETDELDDGAVSVEFLSVTDPTRGLDPTDEELASWWDEHDGDWPIGVDGDGVMNRHYDVSGFPTTVAIDGAGTVHWRSSRGTAASNVVTGVREAVEAETAGGADDESNGGPDEPNTGDVEDDGSADADSGGDTT
ncbi:TlpA family protein disulfide reductase [Natrarchaeobius oligotrophus]|uniref:TlpA family protein disulfide reductase n=1 Tax=Natrarchaeobius chitinivorans TaxID=1679083 RepID=A0A3N6M816_NATCH|nr:TlpA family protein disulfide reductase [Natrarchaeobius chitinivorans]